MKIKTIKLAVLMGILGLFVASCSNDDEAGIVPPVDDGMVDDGMDDDMQMMEPDFSGTFSQVDFMGRPGINTVLSATGEIKDMHNQAVPAEMAAIFQPGFQEQLEALHDAYAIALGADPADINYEPNILSGILGFDVTAEILTTVLANDVLEIAPNAQTTYFDGTVPIGLTGRTLEDDVIDISLILLFGGENGARFNGEGGLPQLVTDGVPLTAENITTTFPYIGAPE